MTKSVFGKKICNEQGTTITKHPLYATWVSMFTRCNNPNDKSYPRYGGRGIKVCARWNDFGFFIADMGPRPKGHSIDRKDNKGDYEPSNCRWATRSQQQRNMRSNHLIQVNGETISMIDVCEKYGIKYTTLKSRIVRGNCTPEQAVTAALRPGSRW